MFRLVYAVLCIPIKVEDSDSMVVAMDPSVMITGLRSCSHSFSACLERTGYGTWGCSRGNLDRYSVDIFFALVPNAFDPSETPLKGP